MNRILISLILLTSILTSFACESASSTKNMSPETITAADILGNPDYRAISFGSYRELSLLEQPTIEQIKEDLLLLNAMGVKMLRTYKAYHLQDGEMIYMEEAENLCKAIRELREEDPDFEMYMMMGVWINAKNSWTSEPDRIRNENSYTNQIEIDKVVELAAEYPDVVKIIAVGNEAMVHWAWEYYVDPEIILGWVEYLQDLKQNGTLPKETWITSSDNFASWGGGGEEYHKEALTELYKAVDFISLHTYPMHDTHYNPMFWGVPEEDENLSDIEKIDNSMLRAVNYAKSQYNSVVKYMESLGIDKPVHIGESGWATVSNEFYGASEAKAIDEYKMGLYHKLMREWTDEEGISLFYFEAFDEQWKNAENPKGSENHFGLITLDGKAKYAIWDLVDDGVFDGLTRDGNTITKTFDGDYDEMMKTVLIPPTEEEVLERVGASQ